MTMEVHRLRNPVMATASFYAWLVHPEHVFESNLMRLSIRLFPNTNGFPGMKKADVNRFDDTVVQATIALEDISVPLWNTQIANRPQSHLQREKARGREALEFCRRAILNASGLLWLHRGMRIRIGWCIVGWNCSMRLAIGWILGRCS